MGKRYSNEELSILYEEFERGTTLSELESILGRPDRGIIRKLQSLLENEPDKWDRVVEYRKQYYWRHRNELLAKADKSRRKNKERIRERKHQHYQDNRAEILAKVKRQYWIHRDEILARRKQQYQGNKEEIRRRDREKYWKNIEVTREKGKERYKEQGEEVRARNRRSHYRRKMYQLIRGIRNTGYDIREVNIQDGVLTVRIVDDTEEGNFSIPMIYNDFRDHLGDAIEKVGIQGLEEELGVEYKGNNIIISLNPRARGKEKLEGFLMAYAKVLKKD